MSQIDLLDLDVGLVVMEDYCQMNDPLERQAGQAVEMELVQHYSRPFFLIPGRAVLSRSGQRCIFAKVFDDRGVAGLRWGPFPKPDLRE